MLALSLYLEETASKEDDDKFTVIYQTYLGVMMKTAIKYVGQYHVEEDIVHNALLNLLGNLDKIDLSEPLRTKSYLCTITKHCALDWLRQKPNKGTDDLDDYAYSLESDEPSPLDLVLQKEGYQKLVRCIHNLPETYRGVCDLKFICGLKEREIAKVLGISLKNVSVRGVRARKMLIKMLKEEKGDDK